MVNIPQSVIEVALALNYLFVIFIIITSKKEIFKNVFYMMFVATGFADVTSILISSYYRINSELQFGPKARDFTVALMVIHGAAFVAHMIGNLFITINRFSILCLKKDSFWSRKNVRIIICLQYTCAFAALVPAIGVVMVYVKNNDGSYTIVGLRKQDELTNEFTYVGAAVLYAVIGIILNVKMLVYLHKMLKLTDSARMAVHEKGMMFCTLIVFGFTMMMCTQQILRGIAILTDNTEFNNWITMHYFWINDVMVGIPPCIQLILNSELRRDIISFFRCRRHQNNPVTSIIMFSNRHPGIDRSSHQGRSNAK